MNSDHPEAISGRQLWLRPFGKIGIKSGSERLKWTAGCLLAAFLILVPLLTIVVLAFLPDETNSTRHLWSTVLPAYIVNTLMLAGGVGAGTLIIGVSTAWLVTAFEFNGRRFLSWSLLMPMAMPSYLIAIAYIELLDFAGPLQTSLRRLFGWKYGTEYFFPSITSMGGAICLLSLVLYPYVFLMARIAFGEQSARMIEAGRTLNLGFQSSFIRLVLPVARPAIIVGLTLVAMETVGDFGLVQLFSVNTLTVGIYNTWFGSNNVAGAARLAVGMLCVVLLLIVMEQRARGRRHYYESKADRRVLPRIVLRGWQGWLAGSICFFPVLGGFLLPLGLQLNWLVETLGNVSVSTFWQDAAHSLLLAAATAACTLLAALVMAFGQRIAPSVLTKAIVRIASSGYALPGPVVALGVLLPLAWLDRSMILLSQELFKLDPGYLLSGSILVLIFGYMVRFMAIAFGSIESGLSRISPDLDAASRSLRKTPTTTLRLVHLPLLQGSMLTAVLLVVVDVMKELPITLMLQPFNFSTLATRAFAYASEEMYREAALWSVAIVAIGLMPVFIVNRRILRLLDHHEPV